MAASIRFQTFFYQPQQTKVTKKPPCPSFGQAPDYNLFDYTSGCNGPTFTQTYTAFNTSQLPTDAVDWRLQFDIWPPDWDLTCLPDDPEPSFFPPNTDYDLLSCPTNHPTPWVTEKHHTPSSNPITEPEPTPPESRSRSSPADSKSKTNSSSESSARVEKRTANTLAARRYRQKRLDQVSELETALKETRRERDAFKNQVFKLQGETELLRDLLRQKS